MLKAWIDAAVIREMDSVIELSGRGYRDRSEFIEEALRDRVEEERHSAQGTQHGAAAEPAVDRHDAGPIETRSPHYSAISKAGLITGEWVDSVHPSATLDAVSGPPTNFGLHNRDLPTLFALDALGRLVAERGEPVTWEDFTTKLSPAAWEVGRQLRDFDQRRKPELRVAPGFPTNEAKRDAAERRFLAHAAGAIKPSGVRGPFFVFGMAGVAGNGSPRIAPSKDAVALVKALVEAGIDEGPPFPNQAWGVFRDYLQSSAPAELSMWLKVLSHLADGPDRSALVSRCDWWSGSAADTNTMGYVARGREWGLVEPQLSDNTYRLTQLGREQIETETGLGAPA